MLFAPFSSPFHPSFPFLPLFVIRKLCITLSGGCNKTYMYICNWEQSFSFCSTTALQGLFIVIPIKITQLTPLIVNVVIYKPLWSLSYKNVQFQSQKSDTHNDFQKQTSSAMKTDIRPISRVGSTLLRIGLTFLWQQSGEREIRY